MGSWRIVDLDPGDRTPPRRGLDPIVVAALVVAALVAVNVVPQLLPRTGAPNGPRLEPTPSAAPAAAWDAFRLLVVPRDALACGSFDEASPPPTFAGSPLATRRIDVDVSVAADPDWAWCVAGARAYADGVELVGTLGVRGRQRTGALRPALRDASFAAELGGFGALGPGELLDAGGYTLLRLRAVTDRANRGAFADAIARTGEVRLRLEAMAGPWTFPVVPLAEGPLDVGAEAYGVRFRLHDLRLLSDAVATTLYARSDFPDPAIASFEWDAVDDVGTTYRALPDRRIDGTLPGFYRAFAPAPPATAREIAFAIRRVHLVALDQFLADLTLR